MATEGDISGGGGSVDKAGKIIGVVDDFMTLFRGKSTSNTVNKDVNLTTTSTEEVSAEKAKALLEQLLGSIQGLATVSSGQKAAGIYDSTVNQQLTNDLLARSTADVAALSSKKTQTQTGSVTDTSKTKQKGALEWIVCTELNKQGRLPDKYYRYGARVFAGYSDYTKQGYYLWAIPAVKHLRAHPTSKLSKFLEVVFTARAEHIAAKAGCKEASTSLFGAMVTSSTYILCVVLSRTIARKPIDFMTAVYPEGV